MIENSTKKSKTIISGAQIRAARGFLGWSQQDLARAAGLHVNVVRYREARHSRPTRSLSASSRTAERITHALRTAGLILTYDPPGVSVNLRLYDAWRRPPIYARWEKWQKDRMESQ